MRYITSSSGLRSKAGAVAAATISGLSMMAFALVSYAADDLEGEQRVANLTKILPAMSAAVSDEQPCTNQTPIQFLSLEGAHGEAFQLVYFGNCGWKYIAAGKTNGVASNLALGQVGFAMRVASYTETAAATVKDPVAVFIDGPTGYTFAWTPDTGWKFVGHLSGNN